MENAAGQQALAKSSKTCPWAHWPTIPCRLSTVGKLDVFSPEFQSLVTDKGAMILHMLRWILGDQKYDLTMRTFATKFAGKSASLDDFTAIAEQNYGDKLTWFFSQWLDSTALPSLRPSTRFTVWETTKAFRVVGQIGQDLDLFRMPVELRIDTNGKTEEKRIEVVGTDSPFTIETFGQTASYCGGSRRPCFAEFIGNQLRASPPAWPGIGTTGRSGRSAT